jgi:hypothetical protein
LLLVAWIAWHLAYPSFGWRQKLTLVVETPVGEVTGSSVSAVRVQMGPNLFMGTPSIGVEFVGEAAFVELAPGRYLFALVSNGPGWASDTFAPVSVEQSFTGRMRMIEQSRGDPPKDIPRDRWPALVTFDDVAKPETVREVDPDDLAAVFGVGVRLKAVTLEITEEDVTVGRVEGVLGWLGPYPEPGLCPATGGLLKDAPFCRLVKMGDFIRRP